MLNRCSNFSITIVGYILEIKAITMIKSICQQALNRNSVQVMCRCVGGYLKSLNGVVYVQAACD